MKVQSLSILLVFLSLVGCALQPHAQESMEGDTQKKTHEEPAKAGMATFIYRPGAWIHIPVVIEDVVFGRSNDADCCIG